MAKNPRRFQKDVPVVSSEVRKDPDAVSSRGKKIMAAGVILVLVGFFVLTRTDPAGKNWASTVSPLLLVLGYAIIGLGIVFPDPSPAASQPEN
jgi:hypothetical protein